MPTYQVWDVPNTALILETKRWGELVGCLRVFVEEQGEEVLDQVKVCAVAYRQPPRFYATDEVLTNILGR